MRTRTITSFSRTPVSRQGFRIGVPKAGYYRELLNTDSAFYGGSNVGNLSGVQAEDVAAHGHPYSLSLSLPPLATLYFEWTDFEWRE